MAHSEGVRQRREDWPDFIPLGDISAETHFLQGPEVLEVFEGLLCVKSLEYANDTEPSGGNGNYVGLELPISGKEHWQIALISDTATSEGANIPPENQVKSEINLGMVKSNRLGVFFSISLRPMVWSGVKMGTIYEPSRYELFKNTNLQRIVKGKC